MCFWCYSISVYSHQARLENLPYHVGNRTLMTFGLLVQCSACQPSYEVKPVRVCDISELSLVPSISVFSIYDHDYFMVLCFRCRKCCTMGIYTTDLIVYWISASLPIKHEARMNELPGTHIEGKDRLTGVLIGSQH